MTQRNKLNWKVPLFWRQSICKRSRCFKVAVSTYYDNHGHEGSLSISLFSTATKNLPAFISDRDIIFRDETDLVFCFLGCVVTFPAREANSWRRRASSNPGNWVCVFFSFFSPSYRFSIFSRSNAHTHTNKEGAKTRGKAERRQRAVRFTRFLDYRLMFDSGRSFSLKNDLIRPPY